jgi:hypothetical protein
MNAILTEIRLAAPETQPHLGVCQQFVAVDAAPRRGRPSPAAKRLWIIGSSLCKAEMAILIVLAIAGLLGIGRCFSVLATDDRSVAPPALNYHGTR